jgi:hypothetical protein
MTLLNFPPSVTSVPSVANTMRFPLSRDEEFLATEDAEFTEECRRENSESSKTSIGISSAPITLHLLKFPFVSSVPSVAYTRQFPRSRDEEFLATEVTVFTEECRRENFEIQFSG